MLRKTLPLAGALLTATYPTSTKSPTARCEGRSLEDVIALIRSDKDLRNRWEKDEDNWRKLPARAWPENQPGVDEESELRRSVSVVCASPKSRTCKDVKFALATCLVFNNLDVDEGFKIYEDNAANGCDNSR